MACQFVLLKSFYLDRFSFNLFSSAYFHESPQSKALVAVFRAAKALSFSKIMKYTIREMQRLWSSDLARSPKDRTCNPADVIAMARELDTPGVLKGALYELVKTPILGQKVVDGDGDVCPLSPRDILLLVSARETLQSEWLKLMTTSMEACEDCEKPNELACSPLSLADNKWRATVIDSGLLKDGLVDVMAAFDRIDKLDFVRMGCCKKCATTRQDSFRIKRKELWLKLDTLFGVRPSTSEGSELGFVDAILAIET